MKAESSLKLIYFPIACVLESRATLHRCMSHQQMTRNPRVTHDSSQSTPIDVTGNPVTARHRPYDTIESTMYSSLFVYSFVIAVFS